MFRTCLTAACLLFAAVPASAADAAVVRQRRGADPDALRLQPGRLPRQGRRPERLPPVAARLRPGAGPRLAHPRVRRPPHQPGRTRREPAPAQAARPGAARGRQAVRRRAAGRTSVLLDWIRAGAPGPREGRADAARARSPARRRRIACEPGQEQQLPSGRVQRRPASATSPGWQVRLQRRRHGRGRCRAARSASAATARRPSAPASRARSPSSSSPPRSSSPSTRRGWRSATTSSTSTSSPSWPPCASSRPTCATTPSSCAAPSSTPSACCRRPTRCAPSWPTRGPTSGRS